MTGQVTVLLGTTKGVFLLSAPNGRPANGWQVRGPMCGGWPINHVIGDPASGLIWAAGGGEWHGAGVWCSRDGGESWTLSKLAGGMIDDWAAKDSDFAAMMGVDPAAPPPPFTGKVKTLWSLCRNGDRLLAGAKPAALFASDDDGATWAEVKGLTDHPSAPEWEPGAAGLVLHTIVPHPQDRDRLWVGISAAGVFATEDGGATWDRRNVRSNASGADHAGHVHEGVGGSGHEVGLCVHNMVRAPGRAGDLMYQQNHHGVFRSPDGGRSWTDITAGLPSHFGFPIAVNPADPMMLWTLPLNGDTEGRFPPGASAAVWRSRDGGDSWQAMRKGLPAENCFFTVLRQAMATDRADPAGVYFGTNSGSVFASFDEGDEWHEIARHLPTVLSVEVLQRG